MPRLFADRRRGTADFGRRRGHIDDDHQGRPKSSVVRWAAISGRAFSAGFAGGGPVHPQNPATATATESHLQIMLQLSHIRRLIVVARTL